jgi:hypothetical protein
MRWRGHSARPTPFHSLSLREPASEATVRIDPHRTIGAMSLDPANAGALAFKRSGDPNIGNFHDATILRMFGEVPENLDEL